MILLIGGLNPSSSAKHKRRSSSRASLFCSGALFIIDSLYNKNYSLHGMLSVLSCWRYLIGNMEKNGVLQLYYVYIDKSMFIWTCNLEKRKRDFWFFGLIFALSLDQKGFFLLSSRYFDMVISVVLHCHLGSFIVSKSLADR